jgi:hypothetical protein
MKILRISLIVLVVIIIALQFVPIKVPENSPVTENDLIAGGYASEGIQKILKTSCYDCHSNQVQFPWYSRVAPVSWLLANDIEEGRRNLNFSEWKKYSKRNMIGKLEDIQDEVTSGAMPLGKYTLIHRDAKLSKEQIVLLKTWTGDLTNKILE